MKWSEDYAIGIAQIDQDHQMIFQMSEDFGAALDEGQGGKVYPAMLTMLSLFCRGHFGFEERCMTKFSCPVAQANKAAHKQLLQAVSGFQQLYTTHGYDQEDARQLVDMVDQWLQNHICRIDIHLKRCVSK